MNRPEGSRVLRPSRSRCRTVLRPRAVVCLIVHTRALVHAALAVALDQVPTRADQIFGLGVPTSCPNVPTEVLDPRRTRSDPKRLRRAGPEAGRALCGQRSKTWWMPYRTMFGRLVRA